MDELDQLKKQWQKDENFNRIDQPEIKTMLHKSSSSIVNWIFITSCIELSIGIILSFIVPNSDKEELPIFEILNYVYEVVFYVTILYFIYNFFLSYSRIKNTNNTKELMTSILITRKQVENYIKFNIYCIIYSSFISFMQEIILKIDIHDQWGMIVLKIIGFMVVFTLITLFFISIFKFYYKILYRRLVNKLNNNYEELIKLEED